MPRTADKSKQRSAVIKSLTPFTEGAALDWPTTLRCSELEYMYFIAYIAYKYRIVQLLEWIN